MLAAAAAGADEGEWLIADRQTAGRGRRGRQWRSEPGNLEASTIVRLRVSDPAAATLAFVAALSLYDALSEWTRDIVLKWPNDLLDVSGAKLSGILLERAGDCVVIGFGVNLASHPENVGRTVTSLCAMGIAPPQPLVFLDALAGTLERWTEIWRRDRLDPIRHAWSSRAHAIGTALTVLLPDGHQVEGKFEGLTDDCAMRLRLADGTLRAMHAGDVFLT